VVSFTFQPLYLPGTDCIGDWVGPRAGLNAVANRKYVFQPAA